jgi:hypothetical protein
LKEGMDGIQYEIVGDAINVKLIERIWLLPYKNLEGGTEGVVDHAINVRIWHKIKVKIWHTPL